MSLLDRFRSGSRPRLEVLLERAAHHARHRRRFYRALLDEKLWVPGVSEHGDVSIEPFEVEGRRTILVFTSRRRLEQALRSYAGALEIPGRVLLEALPPFDSLVIEYATALQKEMTPSEVAALLDGSLFAMLDDERVERVMLGRPRHYPVAMLDELRGMLDAAADVRAAYLCQAQPAGQTPTIVVGLDAASDEALASVARIVETHDASARAIVLGADAISEYMRRETEPWWSRDQR